MDHDLIGDTTPYGDADRAIRHLSVMPHTRRTANVCDATRRFEALVPVPNTLRND